MAEETIILMHTNLGEVSRKTGIPYDDLSKRYRQAKEKNSLVILKIDREGRIIFE
jgi:hypothetical protein